MGTIIHDAIIVTGFQEEHVQTAHALALELGLVPTNIVRSTMNKFFSFMIAPDGSKEDWPESDAGDDARERWLKRMHAHWGAADFFVQFVHVRFGDTSPRGGKGAPVIADWSSLEDER